MANSRSITEINELVAKGDAFVLTVQEISDIVKGGEDLTIKECGCSHNCNPGHHERDLYRFVVSYR